MTVGAPASRSPDSLRSTAAWSTLCSMAKAQTHTKVIARHQKTNLTQVDSQVRVPRKIVEAGDLVGAGDDEAETSADESRAEPGTGEPEQTASAAEGTLGRGTRRAATSTDYGGPVARRRRAEDGEAEQTRRARRGREQDFAEISRRMYEEIRSSRDPRDHVEDG